MAVRLLFFAWVREAVGQDALIVDLPADCRTTGDVADQLALRWPLFADRDRLRVAVDLAMADWQSAIDGAHEIAFFPPVTGG